MLMTCGTAAPFDALMIGGGGGGVRLLIGYT